MSREIGDAYKKFSRKCGYCDRIFGHWRSHWNHEKKCRLLQAETTKRNTEWQKPGWHGPELTEAEAFKGFTDKD